MSEIKPVYESRQHIETASVVSSTPWQEVSFEAYQEHLKVPILQTRVLYPAAAYEALKKENAELKEAIKKQSNAVNAFYAARSSEDKNRDGEIIRLRSLDADNKGLKECNAILTDENAAQAKRIAELEGIFKMLALRAKSFPSFPIGGHIPEVFFAIGESDPDYLDHLAAPEYQQIEMPEDLQRDWKGIDGAIAYHLIDRHADNWGDVGRMMEAWLKANQSAPEYQEPLSAIAPDPRMHEPWTDEERSDLRNAVVDIFNRKPNQEPTKDE